MMNARRARAVAFGSIGLGLIVGACSGDQIADNGLVGGGNTTAPGSGPGSGPGGNGAGGSGGDSSSASFMTSAGPGSGGSGGEDTCAQDEAEATIINQPVDIIFVIDNSGSMSAEIEDVELQINQNFAAIINAADPPIDYRVVMVSEFGEYNDNAICIAAPLGGVPEDPNNLGHCLGPPAAPVNTANFFHHAPNVNNPGVSSHNALCRLGEALTSGDKFGLQPNGIVDVLRPDAFKLVVVVTDDRPDNSDAHGCTFGVYDDNNNITGNGVDTAFDTDIRTASPIHFGDPAGERNYVFHSIISLAPYMADAQNPYGVPHPPDDTVAPIITAECNPSAQNPGTGYQALSLLTGGYRYPTCGLDYTLMFELLAQGVIEGAAVPCQFDIPEPPQGETLDLDTVVVEYTDGNMVTTTLTKVADAASCTDDGFYYEGDTIRLCDEACNVVQLDEDAEIVIKFGCELDDPN